MAKTGDTRNKRTDIQIEQDRDFVARHYFRGIPHAKIAEMLVLELKRDYILSRQQIEYDIKAICKVLRERYESTMDELIFEQLKKIDELEAEAWAAWETSKKARKKTTIITKKNQVDAKPGDIEPPKDPQDVIIENADQVGDVRYFEKVQWCIEVRLKLLGYFRVNQYARTVDSFGGTSDKEAGIVIYLPENNR